MRGLAFAAGFVLATVAAVVAQTPVWSFLGSSGFSAGNAKNLVLSFDINNVPHVAFRDMTVAEKVTVMRYSNTSNTWSVLGSAGFTAGKPWDYVSLAFSPTNVPYIAYGDNSLTNKATVMAYGGTSWSAVGTAGFSAGAAVHINLAIDTAGTPYVTFSDQDVGGGATVMKFSSNAWSVVGTSGFSPGGSSYNRIAFDSSNVPYVAFSDAASASKATVMKFFGGNWQNVGASLFSAGAASYLGLALDSSNVPYVAYRDGANSNSLTVMKYNGAAWAAVGSAGFTAGAASWVSLTIDRTSGTPYVAFTDENNSNKGSVARYVSSAWSYVTSRAFTSSAAYYTSLAVDRNNVPHLAYVDADPGLVSVMKTLCTAGTAGYWPSCPSCPSGQYSNSTGLTTCLSCAAGTFASSTGSTGCIACDAGFYSSSGAATCTGCPPGTRSSAGASSCSGCPAGSYTTGNASSCSSCTSGTYSSANSSTCLGCPAGTFSGSSAPYCQGCSPGQFSAANSSSCSVCTAGYYSSANSSSCQGCPAGTFSSSGASACQGCNTGYFSTGNASTCSACSAGTYAPQRNASSCQTCAAGTFSSSAATNCSNCSVGTFSSAGASSCTFCYAGTFSNTTGSSLCLDCPPATSAPSSGSTNCSTCLPGEYAPSSKTPTCLKCPAGTYMPYAGSTVCYDCGLGSYSAADGSSKCISCATSYGATTRSTRSTAFSDCVALEGYYWSNGGKLLQCFPKSACLGGSSGRCADGYEGVGCATCATGYYRTQNSECAACRLPYAALVSMGVIVLVFLLACVSYQPWRLFVMSFLCAFRPLIVMLQLCGILFQVSTSYGSSPQPLFQFAAIWVGDLSVFDTGCALSLSTIEWLFVRLAVILFCTLCPLLWACVRKLRPKACPPVDVWRPCVAAVLLLFSLTFLPLMNVGLSAFHCRVLADGSYALVKDPSVHCYDLADSTWQSQFIFCIVVLSVLSIAWVSSVFPVLFSPLRLLTSGSLHLIYENLLHTVQHNSRGSLCFILLLGNLRSTLAVIVQVFLATNPVLQLLSLIILFLSSGLCIVLYRPHRLRHSLFIEACSHLLLLLLPCVSFVSMTIGISRDIQSGVSSSFSHSTVPEDAWVAVISICLLLIFSIFVCSLFTIPYFYKRITCGTCASWFAHAVAREVQLPLPSPYVPDFLRLGAAIHRQKVAQLRSFSGYQFCQWLLNKWNCCETPPDFFVFLQWADSQLTDSQMMLSVAERFREEVRQKALLDFEADIVQPLKSVMQLAVDTETIMSGLAGSLTSPMRRAVSFALASDSQPIESRLDVQWLQAFWQRSDDVGSSADLTAEAQRTSAFSSRQDVVLVLTELHLRHSLCVQHVELFRRLFVLPRLKPKELTDENYSPGVEHPEIVEPQDVVVMPDFADIPA